MNSIALKTYAKINLSLDVTGVREDGYHEVKMIMQAVNLYDQMRVRVIPCSDWKITLKTDKYYVPVDERNTAYKAAVIMSGHIPQSSAAEIRIDIKKNIPVAAGLAGGSSNAAGVIVALDRLFGLDLGLDELCRIGAQVGADVPFCILSMYDDVHSRESGKKRAGSTCALAEGLGEILTPLPPVRAWVLLAKPPAGVSTAEVYKKLDACGGYAHPDTAALLAGIRTGNVRTLMGNMVNVLENVTIRDYPVVGELKNRMMLAAPVTTMMSGSGPTVFSLFNSRNSGSAAMNKIRDLADKKYSLFLVRTLA